MSNEEILKMYDEWISDEGPSALVIRDCLEPVEGKEGVLFPPTFAASKDNIFKGGYNIDEFSSGSNLCLIDSIGSQANRIEPIFKMSKFSSLVPQIIVKAGEKQINLLDAGHRAGDAIVRCSGLKEELQQAFKEVSNGNAESLAKIAPTSLVFGVWDSRDTQVKLPRLIASTIRAFDVQKLTRSAQYVPATDYVNEGLLDKPADKKIQEAYAERGFVHQPATGSHGGIIAKGEIRRDFSLHLSALRLLSVGNNQEKTTALRRYILGLALVAFTAPLSSYLRQGCNLVLCNNKPREIKKVYSDGRRVDITISPKDAFDYADAAAKEFGVGPNRIVNFEKELAKREIEGGKKQKNLPK